jgi:mono/diheme cytochrome c family protein
MRRVLLIVVAVVVVIGVAVYFALVYKPAIAPHAADQTQTFDAALVAHGSALAAIGDCASCHTAPVGPALAGGVAVPTPYGTIYATNITPDRETGIGAWSFEAFSRAMREGIDREGHHLYPAFPFDHFTHVTDDDNKALYAYLMTRDAVPATPPANQLSFPYNIRSVMAGWNLLFLKAGPLADDPSQSAEWNRGHYLVEGLGHCGSCHTPRNSLGAEDGSKSYSGGPVVEGWYTYPINQSSPAPQKWDVASLEGYLKTGYSAEHGVSRGPMAQVTARLREASDDDVHAMAVYVASLMGNGGAAAPATTTQASIPLPPQSGDSMAPPDIADASANRGAMIYATACSSCHESGRPPPFGGIDFHKSTAIHADNPQNIVNMTLYGLPAGEGRTFGMMPGFAGTLGQDDMVALLTYLRATFSGGKPAWTDLPGIVAATMSGKTAVKLYSQDGVQRAGPATPAAGTAP